MSRAVLVATALLAAAGCGGGSSPAPPPPPEAARVAAGRPWNVLLITIDTLRADHLGAYGYPLPTSPAIGG